MWIAYLNLAGSLLLLGFLIWAACHMVTLTCSLFFGAPYVATKRADLDRIFDRVEIRAGSVFLDLGCGDGRVVRYICERFKIQAFGIERNPLLVLLARWRSRTSFRTRCKYLHGSITNAPFSACDIVYLFLFPKLIEKLKLPFSTELKPGTIVISHGFPIPYLKSQLREKITHKPFHTYIYQV